MAINRQEVTIIFPPGPAPTWGRGGHAELVEIIQEDQQALALITGYWQIPMLEAASNNNISRLEEQKAKVDRFFTQHLPDAHTVGISNHIDHLMGAIYYHNTTHGDKNFTELQFVGINPQGVESIWNHLSSIAGKYVQARGDSVPSIGSIAQAITARKSNTISAQREANRLTSGFLMSNQNIITTVTSSIYHHARLHFGVDTVNDNAEIQALQNAYIEAADNMLAEKLGYSSTEEIPFSYSWFASQDINGLIFPQFDTLVRFNDSISKGEPVHINCCPNYATAQENGTHIYTFETLGTDIGLTAERGLPFIAKIVIQATKLEKTGKLRNPLNIRVAIADFEAQEANAELVGLSVEEFKRHLGKSIESMIATTIRETTEAGLHHELTRTNDTADPLGEWILNIEQASQPVTTISFGAVTRSYSDLPGYNEKNFYDLVAQERVRLAHESVTNTDFQRALDKVLQLRLGLMLRWRDGQETVLVQQLGELFDALHTNNFSQHILRNHLLSMNGANIDGLVSEVNNIIEQSSSKEAKSCTIKSIILQWLKEGVYTNDQARIEALRLLRMKVAKQGAEYSVMSRLHARQKGSQLVADSLIMWEVFGDIFMPRIAVKGGYEGADK